MFMLACGGAKQPFSEKYNEQEIKEITTEIIVYLIEEKYEDVEARFAEGVKAQMPIGKLKEVVEPIILKFGEYKEVREFITEEKDDIAYISAFATFADGEIIFTLGFDEQLKITTLRLN